MKKLPFAVFLALVGTGFYTSSAHASGVLTYTAGDIFIGFVDGTAPSNDYLVDVGPATLYTTPGAPFELSSTYIGTASQNNTNLSTVFAADSSGWWASTATNWGIIGGPLSTDNQDLMYVGVPRTTADNVPTTAPTADNATAQGIYLQSIQQMEAYYHSAGSALNGTKGTSQSTADSDSFAQLSNGAAFGDSNLNNFYNNINGDGNGDVGDVIDLWTLPPTGSGSPTYDGNFAINSTGAIIYTPATVPEPSAWAALAGGVGLLGLVRRRRAVTA